jgi:hypothetical protein
MDIEEFECDTDVPESSLVGKMRALIEKYEAMPADEFVEHFEAVASLKQGSFFARRQL